MHPLYVEGTGAPIEAELEEETHDSSPDVSFEQEQDEDTHCTHYVLPIAEV